MGIWDNVFQNILRKSYWILLKYIHKHEAKFYKRHFLSENPRHIRFNMRRGPWSISNIPWLSILLSLENIWGWGLSEQFLDIFLIWFTFWQGKTFLLSDWTNYLNLKKILTNNEASVNLLDNPIKHELSFFKFILN